MNLNDVMDAIGTRLDTITGLRVYESADGMTPPGAVLVLPDEIEYDTSYGRGSDRMTLPVLVVVGRASDRAARDNLAAYADGSGASSVKAVLEGGTYTAMDSVRVTRVDFDYVSINSVSYLAALFEIDIFGQGS